MKTKSRRQSFYRQGEFYANRAFPKKLKLRERFSLYMGESAARDTAQMK
jgi:hypothetical protein